MFIANPKYSAILLLIYEHLFDKSTQKLRIGRNECLEGRLSKMAVKYKGSSYFEKGFSDEKY